MSTSTPNIGLTLPIGKEKVSRAIINANMTKIDTAFGNMNRATMRKVPFTIDVADWSGSGSSWSATYLTDYVTSTSHEILTYDSSLRPAKAEDIDAAKKSGGGGIVFSTTKKPIASISGSIYVWDTDDGKIPVIIEGTVTPIANGGTGASSVAGAKNNLGISAVENSVQSLSEQIANLITRNNDSFSVTFSAANTWTKANGSITIPANKAFGIYAIQNNNESSPNGILIGLNSSNALGVENTNRIASLSGVTESSALTFYIWAKGGGVGSNSIGVHYWYA